MRRVLPLQGAEAILVLLAFLVFFVFMAAQHQLVFLYHDDYGVAVLAYPDTATGEHGRRPGIAETGRFLADMYTEWSGRILSLLVMVVGHALGLEFLRWAQVVIIAMVVMLALAAASRESGARWGLMASLLAMAAFLTWPAGALINGVYWFSASIHYLWFMPLFLAAVYIAALRGKLTAGCTVLLSAAALAHEQLACGALAFALVHAVLTEARGVAGALGVLPRLIPVVAAAAITTLAPGNFARAKAGAGPYADGLMATVQENAALLAGQVFAPGHDKNYFIYLMLGSLVPLAVHAVRQRTDAGSWLAAFTGGAAVGMAVLYQTGHLVAYMSLFLVACTTLLAVAVSRQRSGRVVFAVHLAAVVTLLPLLFAPAVASRSAIPFFALALVPTVYAFMLMPGTRGKAIQVLIVALIGIKAVDNAGYIHSGLRDNAEVLEVNDRRLRVAAFLQANRPGTIPAVQLFKVPRPRFAEKMPYDKPVIGSWMKAYYGLDQDTALAWREMPE